MTGTEQDNATEEKELFIWTTIHNELEKKMRLRRPRGKGGSIASAGSSAGCRTCPWEAHMGGQGMSRQEEEMFQTQEQWPC